MTSFSRQWSDAYVAIPADSEDAKQGAKRIRELKSDIRERMLVDHEWSGDDNDGKHAILHMRAQTADPTTDATCGQLYCKLQGASIEVYFKDSAGNVFPITSAGGGIANIILPGTIIAVGNQTIADGVSYIQCDGRAVSRTGYGGLFVAIGIGWGGGDGSTTFNVPDLRGRTVIGAGTGTGLSARVTGQTMGVETYQLTIQEIPGHLHALLSNNASNAPGSSGSFVQAASNSGPVGFTGTAGGDPGTGIANPHQNMQPSAVVNYWIKT